MCIKKKKQTVLTATEMSRNQVILDTPGRITRSISNAFPGFIPKNRRLNLAPFFTNFVRIFVILSYYWILLYLKAERTDGRVGVRHAQKLEDCASCPRLRGDAFQLSKGRLSNEIWRLGEKTKRTEQEGHR